MAMQQNRNRRSPSRRRSGTPRRSKSPQSPAASDRAPSVSTRQSIAGGSLWSRYQSLLIAHPYGMQIVQACVLASLGNVCNQCVFRSHRRFDTSLLTEQVATNALLAPIMVGWLRKLRSWRLHWLAATLVDQVRTNPG